MTSGPWAHGSGRGRGCRAGDALRRLGRYLLTAALCAVPVPDLQAAATPPPVHACMHYTSGQRRCPLLPAEAHSLAPTDDSFQDREWNNCQKLREKKTSPETIIYRHSLCARM